MTELQPNSYGQEIRDWFLGRLVRRHADGRLRRPVRQQVQQPILRWWIFEGRRYKGLDGPLCANWELIERQIRRLLSSFNPTWRITEHPDGEIDWIATALQRLSSVSSTYVTRATRTGLQEDELQALNGWITWISHSWFEYNRLFEVAANDPPFLPFRQSFQPDEASQQMFRRWAHTAKRSRWGLLRNVVAETFRCFLEPQELDRLPLPTQPDKLFELLCAVRVLRSLFPQPRQIRWLMHEKELGQNVIVIPGARYTYQKSICRDAMIRSEIFDPGLRRALLRQPSIRQGWDVDGWLALDQPINGLDGIVIEAKSGAQGLEQPLYQLMLYRSALKEAGAGRLFMWGVVEKQQEATNLQSQLRSLCTHASTALEEDVWFFSDASAIPQVISAVFGR